MKVDETIIPHTEAFSAQFSELKETDVLLTLVRYACRRLDSKFTFTKEAELALASFVAQQLLFTDPVRQKRARDEEGETAASVNK